MKASFFTFLTFVTVFLRLYRVSDNELSQHECTDGHKIPAEWNTDVSQDFQKQNALQSNARDKIIKQFELHALEPLCKFL